MKLLRTAFSIVLLSVAMAPGEDAPPKLDTDAAKARLSGTVTTIPGKFITKGVGGSPVVSRFYTKDAVVITRSNGGKEEHPYVAVPIRFRVDSDELFDATSRENLGKLATLMKAMSGGEFAIEGHASAEGDPQRNRALSSARALKIQSLLQEQGVSASMIVRVEGFGSEHATHPANAPERQRQEDRRVLIVRER